MWRKVFLIPLACFMAMPILATDVEVRLKAEQSRIILGEPLSMVITVQNTSGRTLDLPFEPIFAGTAPAVLVGNSGGGVEMSTTGAAMMCEEVGTTITAPFAWKMGSDFDIVVPARESVSFHSELRLPATIAGKPGTYRLVAHYEGRGKHLAQEAGIVGPGQSPNANYVCEQCWKGSAESAPVAISLDLPTGTDLSAYNAFKGQPLASRAEVFHRYPTSTYAAYVVYDKLKSSIPGVISPGAAVVGEDARKYALLYVAPKPEDKVYKAIPGLLNEQIGQIERVLECHPGFPFRSGLLFILGTEELERQRFPQSVMAFKKCLEENPTPMVAETAKIYLDVLKDHGWK